MVDNESLMNDAIATQKVQVVSKIGKDFGKANYLQIGNFDAMRTEQTRLRRVLFSILSIHYSINRSFSASLVLTYFFSLLLMKGQVRNV